MDTQGRTAIVTGGARRVGRALSLALAGAGARVVVNYHRSRAEADDTVAEIAAVGGSALAVQADVSREADTARLVEAAADRFGSVDIVVNSASLFESAPFEQIAAEDWDRVLAVNLRGPFLLSRAAVPLLRRDGGGVIVNILDLSAFQPWPSYAHHGVAKAGLAHLTRILARALAPEVRVNAIAPGTVLPPEDAPEDEIRRDRERTPLQRLGSPADVAGALLYLVRSDFVTGDILLVDGGRMLR
jgi:pteridine reductase